MRGASGGWRDRATGDRMVFDREAPGSNRLRDAELVAFWVEHHDMVEVIIVSLLADGRRPRGGEFGCLRTDVPLALSHVPRWLACHPDVDVHPVLRGLPLGHSEKRDGRADAVRVDDGRTVGFVVSRLSHVSERVRPERRN